MHADDAPHGQPHPMLPFRREVPVQCDADHNPGRNHHGAAATTTTNGSNPFTMERPLQLAQSALECMMSIQTVPPAMRHPCGITQHPPTAHTTSKATCSIRAGKPCAGISSAPTDVPVKDITTNVQVVGTPTTEPKDAPSISVLPARLLSRAVTPYNTDSW